MDALPRDVERPRPQDNREPDFAFDFVATETDDDGALPNNKEEEEEDDDDDDDDDCIILETNPFKEKSSTTVNHSKRLSSPFSSRRPHRDRVPDGGDDDDDCVILDHNPLFEARRPPASLSMRHPLNSEDSQSHENINNKTAECDADVVDHEITSINFHPSKNHSTNVKVFHHHHIFESKPCIFIVDDTHFITNDDDCIIVEPNSKYFEEVTNGIFDLCKKFSSQQLQDEDISIIAERGQVACRDYPHSRHHCAQYPFNLTPHESCCDQCYCFVCDTKAPCQYWKNTVDGHCDASELESKWKEMRDANRLSRTS